MKKPKYTEEQLNKALLDGFDLMRRVLLEGIYIMLGDTAKCIYEDKPLDCDGLDFGIEQRYVTKEVLSTLRAWTKGIISSDGFTYEFEGVPLRFKFIKKKYKFLEYPDVKFYGPEQYKIPNPFEDYYKARGLVR